MFSKTNISSVRGFHSSARLLLPDNYDSDNDSVLTEFSDVSIYSNKEDLEQKISKLTGRLNVSNRNSSVLCSEIRDANKEMRDFIEKNKGLDKDISTAYEDSNDNLPKGVIRSLGNFSDSPQWLKNDIKSDVKNKHYRSWTETFLGLGASQNSNESPFV